MALKSLKMDKNCNIVQTDHQEWVPQILRNNLKFYAFYGQKTDFYIFNRNHTKNLSILMNFLL